MLQAGKCFSMSSRATSTGATLTIFVALLVASNPRAEAQRPVAELPRVYIDTTYQQPTGPVVHVHPADNLQAAIDAAPLNSTIILDAGGAYTGTFQIKAKSGSGWLYIQTSGTLPPPGTRVTAADAPQMAKIVSPNMSSPFMMFPKPNGIANHIRLIGLEITTTSQVHADPNHRPWPINGQSPVMVSLQGVNNITIDRCYIHGSDTEDVIHAVIAFQGASYIAVVDSQISDIHTGGLDSQAFLATSSLGPFKLTNNFLSASTEDIMFGGGGVLAPPPYNTYVPSDIEMHRNHLYKPPEWIPMTTGATPWKWIVKNNFECKSCLRLVATGNTLENAWLSGQTGGNVLLTPRTSQSGPDAVVDDITIESNLLKNANQTFSVIGYDDTCRPPSCTSQGETARVVISNNLILTRSPNDVASYHPLAFSMGHRMRDMLFQHNTVQGIDGSQSWASFYFNQGRCPIMVDQPTNIWILDNVLSRQSSGDCARQGQQALDSYIPQPTPDSSRYIGNVMFVPTGDNLASWPPHNYATTVPFIFADPSQGDYELVSPYWTDTSDGTLSGVDMNALNQAMSQ